MSRCIRCGQEREKLETVFCPKTQGGIAHEYPLENLYTGEVSTLKGEWPSQAIAKAIAAFLPPPLRGAPHFNPIPQRIVRRLPFPMPITSIGAACSAAVACNANVICKPVALIVAPENASDFVLNDVTFGIGARATTLSFHGMRGDMFPPIPDPEKVKAISLDFPTLQTGQNVVLSVYNQSAYVRQFSAMFICLYVEDA